MRYVTMSGSVQHHGYAMQRTFLDHDSMSVRTPVSMECFKSVIASSIGSRHLSQH